MTRLAAKRRKVDNKEAAIDIKLFPEVTEGMCIVHEGWKDKDQARERQEKNGEKMGMLEDG